MPSHKRRLVARHARLADGGHVGQHGRALVARGRERAHLAAVDDGLHGRDRIQHDLDVPAHHGVARIAAVLEGHVQEVGAGHGLEQLDRQMIGRARTGRGVGELAGLGLGEGYKLLQRRGLHRRRDHQHQVRVVDRRHRGEIAHQRVGLVGQQRLVGGERVGHHQQRVAVGGRLGDDVGADRAARPRLVLDHELLLQRLAQLLAEDARVDVGRPARPERHHDPDWPAGPGLAQRRRGRDGKRSDQQTASCNAMHDDPPWTPRHFLRGCTVVMPWRARSR